MRFWFGGLLFDADGDIVRANLNDAETLGIAHLVCEDRRAGIPPGGARQNVIDVVAV